MTIIATVHAYMFYSLYPAAEQDLFQGGIQKKSPETPRNIIIAVFEKIGRNLVESYRCKGR